MVDISHMNKLKKYTFRSFWIGLRFKFHS